MSTSSINKQREATAYHEAGHAVMEVFFGGKLKSVSIVPLPGSAGRVTHHLKPTLENTDWAGNYATLGRRFPRIIILLAGDIAQRKYRPSSFRSWHPRKDFEAVADYVFNLCAGNTKEANALTAWLVLRTENHVDLLWPTINKFAQRLLESAEIGGSEATSFIRREFDFGETFKKKF